MGSNDKETPETANVKHNETCPVKLRIRMEFGFQILIDT